MCTRVLALVPAHVFVGLRGGPRHSGKQQLPPYVPHLLAFPNNEHQKQNACRCAASGQGKKAANVSDLWAGVVATVV